MFLAEMFSINVILQDIQRLKIFTLKAFSVYVFTFQYLLELLAGTVKHLAREFQAWLENFLFGVYMSSWRLCGLPPNLAMRSFD